MTTNDTCPHCGCSEYNEEIYLCNTLIADPSKSYEKRSIFCSKLFGLKEQLAAQAEEIERLRKALSLIYIYAKNDANSEYCSDTAFDALKEVK
jgi:hypothetical protein